MRLDLWLYVVCTQLLHQHFITSMFRVDEVFRLFWCDWRFRKWAMWKLSNDLVVLKRITWYKEERGKRPRRFIIVVKFIAMFSFGFFCFGQMVILLIVAKNIYGFEFWRRMCSQTWLIHTNYVYKMGMFILNVNLQLCNVSILIGPIIHKSEQKWPEINEIHPKNKNDAAKLMLNATNLFGNIQFNLKPKICSNVQRADLRHFISSIWFEQRTRTINIHIFFFFECNIQGIKHKSCWSKITRALYREQ